MQPPQPPKFYFLPPRWSHRGFLIDVLVNGKKDSRITSRTKNGEQILRLWRGTHMLGRITTPPDQPFSDETVEAWARDAWLTHPLGGHTSPATYLLDYLPTGIAPEAPSAARKRPVMGSLEDIRLDLLGIAANAGWTLPELDRLLARAEKRKRGLVTLEGLITLAAGVWECDESDVALLSQEGSALTLTARPLPARQELPV